MGASVACQYGKCSVRWCETTKSSLTWVSAPRSDPARSMSDSRPTTAPNGDAGVAAAPPRPEAGGGCGVVSYSVTGFGRGFR